MTATPDDGSVFSGWFGFESSECSNSRQCTVLVDGFKYLIAQFDRAPTNFILTVSKTGTASGTIVSDPSSGIDCGADCTEDYAINAQVALTPLPARASSFRGWSGDCSGTGHCKVFMYKDMNVSATFSTATPKTYIVSNLNNSGAESLRQAIMDANANSGDDFVIFQAGLKGTIILTSGQMDISDSVIIDGTGANVLAISGNNASRIFKIDPGTIGKVEINGLTLKDGYDISGNGGGAIIIENGTVSLNALALVNNSADAGGGGGGIRKFGHGNLTISDSTLSGNSAIDEFDQGEGGGIRIDQNMLTLINTTVSGNLAANGGGISINSGTLVISNSTVIRNSAFNGGGGIFNGSGEIILSNSIVAGNTAPIDQELQTYGTLTSRGHNLFGVNGDSGVTVGTVLLATDLILDLSISTVIDPLADNGGPTQTHLPVIGGPAIDAGDNSLIPQGVTAGQRGPDFSRIVNCTIDIGAVENSQNSNISLADIIIVLQILSGALPANPIDATGDVNGNNRIDLAEAIFKLQHMAELHPICVNDGDTPIP